jgi:hypothetical protein
MLPCMERCERLPSIANQWVIGVANGQTLNRSSVAFSVQYILARIFSTLCECKYTFGFTLQLESE